MNGGGLAAPLVPALACSRSGRPNVHLADFEEDDQEGLLLLGPMESYQAGKPGVDTLPYEDTEGRSETKRGFIH